jgi:hypothetical protein
MPPMGSCRCRRRLRRRRVILRACSVLPRWPPPGSRATTALPANGSKSRFLPAPFRSRPSACATRTWLRATVRRIRSAPSHATACSKPPRPYLFIACGNPTFWNKFASGFDRPDLVADPRFENVPWYSQRPLAGSRGHPRTDITYAPSQRLASTPARSRRPLRAR